MREHTKDENPNENVWVRKTKRKSEKGQTARIVGLYQPPPNGCSENHNTLCRQQTLTVVTNSNARGASPMGGSNIQMVLRKTK